MCALRRCSTRSTSDCAPASVLCAGRCPRDAKAVLLGQCTIIKSCSIRAVVHLVLDSVSLGFPPVLLASRYTLNKVVLLVASSQFRARSRAFHQKGKSERRGRHLLCNQPRFGSRKQLRFYSSGGYLRDKPSYRPPRQLFLLQDMYIRQTGAFPSPPPPPSLGR